jgi:hypothetical protein
MTTAPTSTAASILEQFKWEPQPEAERWLQKVESFIFEALPGSKQFAARLERECGVRWMDLIDEIAIDANDKNLLGFMTAGWKQVAHERRGIYAVYQNASGIFPSVVLIRGIACGVALKVESVADFLAANGLSRSICNRPFSSYRRAQIEDCDSATWSIVEKHGSTPFNFDGDSPNPVELIGRCEAFRTRRRSFNSTDEGFETASQLIDESIHELGVDRACDLFFAAEREYWQRRNRAAQVQKARQDRLGIGWANHDHHTYRSSRQHFSRLIAIWEKLGFVCRERFYAGKEAGWGAQILEQPNAGIVTFNDVDLAPDELLIDFAHEPLPERKELGTVGLWCALHGESFLEAGMHHLECTFDFTVLKEQLERDHGVGVMKPFTDFPHLKQAFTVGERWPVREERIAALLQNGQITPEEAEKFRTEGAIGSHLENLERNQGFKGFNQTGVSEIIAATDPRKHLA